MRGYGFFHNRLDALRANPALPTLPLLATKSILFLTEAQPRNKATMQVALTYRRLGPNVAAFGTFASAPLTALQTFGGKETVNLSANYRVGSGLRLGAGVQNFFYAMPDTIPDQSTVLAATGEAS